MIPTVTIDGAVPVVTGTFSHLPPSAVVAVTVQFEGSGSSVFDLDSLGGGACPGAMEKLAWPATSPKYAPPAGATYSVTGTVMVGVALEYWTITICPV